MTAKSRAQYLRDRMIKSLEGDLQSSQTFLPSRYHKRAVELSVTFNERLPVVLGRLVVYAIDHLYGKEPQPIFSQAPVAPALVETDMSRLTQAILLTRFPGDTGPARFRQLGFLNLVAAMTRQGRHPSAASLSRETGVHRTQIERLAKQMVERGVITSERMLGVEDAPTVKVFSIRPNAVDSLSAFHEAQTGRPLDLAVTRSDAEQAD